MGGRLQASPLHLPRPRRLSALAQQQASRVDAAALQPAAAVGRKVGAYPCRETHARGLPPLQLEAPERLGAAAAQAAHVAAAGRVDAAPL